MENFAPDRTETKSGFAGLPNSLPSSFSKFASAASNCAGRVSGIFSVTKNSRQASVVIVKPGGTGKPIFTISARFAPFPPSRSDCVRSPNVNG